MQANIPHSDVGAISGARSSGPAVRLPRRLLYAAWQGVIIILLTLTCYYLISNYLVQNVRVVGASMSPTLADSDSYLLNRWIYLVRSPKSSEIIVLRDPADNGLSVKRVVACPGDLVEFKSGNLFVNGTKLQEPYLPAYTFTFTDAQTRSFKCGADQFFVLGDNRNNSVDSRFYGPVPLKNIIGLIIR